MPAASAIVIGVFGLFHPTELWIQPAGADTVVAGKLRLEGNQTAKLRLGHTGSVHVTSVAGGPADFVLIVPGRFQRRFRGVLTVQPAARELTASVEMDLESAVASVVAAESAPGSSLEALKAQAVVARSYYAGSAARHSAFEFCDTTHCQFLKEVPSPGSLAAHAAEDTRGLMLSYQGRVLPALYSAACGGRTRALSQPGIDYPYFVVECDYCSRHPREPVRGHRLGMCQQGAAAMAASGATFRAILNHYYPATAVVAWPEGISQTPSKFTKKQSTCIAGNFCFTNAAALASSSE